MRDVGLPVWSLDEQSAVLYLSPLQQRTFRCYTTSVYAFSSLLHRQAPPSQAERWAISRKEERYKRIEPSRAARVHFDDVFALGEVQAKVDSN